MKGREPTGAHVWGTLAEVTSDAGIATLFGTPRASERPLGVLLFRLLFLESPNWPPKLDLVPCVTRRKSKQIIQLGLCIKQRLTSVPSGLTEVLHATKLK